MTDRLDTALQAYVGGEINLICASEQRRARITAVLLTAGGSMLTFMLAYAVRRNVSEWEPHSCLTQYTFPIARLNGQMPVLGGTIELASKTLFLHLPGDPDNVITKR